MRPVRDADHTPTSSAEVKKKLSYNSTHPMGPPGPFVGIPLPFLTNLSKVLSRHTHTVMVDLHIYANLVA
jgi:hypothetical protein